MIREVTCPFCGHKKEIEDMFPVGTVPLTLEDIIRFVCDATMVNRDMLLTRNRKREVVITKQIIYYFASYCTILSLSNMAMEVAAEDHATALHGKKTIERDVEFRDKKIVPIIEMIKYRMLLAGFKLPPFNTTTYDDRLHASLSICRYKQIETMKKKTA